MIFGYARVSTHEQNLDLQLDAFLKYGISEKNIYSDVVSGAKAERTQLNKLLSQLRAGDVLVVWKLDRLARSLIHFTKLIDKLNTQGVQFKSITEAFIDTTTDSPHAKFIINMFASLAQLERDIIRERTKAGLESARRRGKILGAPKGLSEKNKQVAMLCEQHFNEGVLTIDLICKKLNISRATYYKYLKLRGLGGKLRSYNPINK